MKTSKLKSKLAQQAATITQLLSKNESMKHKVIAYLESANLYKSENEDLRGRCNEVEEILRQEESKLEIANKEKLEVLELNKQVLEEKQKAEYELVTQKKDIAKYQEAIKELQIAKQKAEEIRKEYFAAVVAKEDECRRLRAELGEATMPFWKKVLKIN